LATSERAGKLAGLRIHVLICVGSALFTISSLYGFGAVADPSRVAAGAGLYVVSTVTAAVMLIVLLPPHPIR